jgi:hypothetical protein
LAGIRPTNWKAQQLNVPTAQRACHIEKQELNVPVTLRSHKKLPACDLQSSLAFRPRSCYACRTF